ncbi:MAG: translation initiation factor IF-3 [Oscillospiraceae bacterium]|nr:translation initiation factor IF-3 [Oscillospiraceae bacterium]
MFFCFDLILWGCTLIDGKEQAVNEQIREKEVRLISSDGEQLGIMSSSDALKIAQEQELDLVLIAPQAKPPVCRIMDYSKFKYAQAKKVKEARKKQKTIEIKEIRLSLNIDTHDFETKLSHARRFLSEGNKVKVTIRFRGRERAHPENGEYNMNRFAEALSDICVVDKKPVIDGRSMQMFLSPKPASAKDNQKKEKTKTEE